HAQMAKPSEAEKTPSLLTRLGEPAAERLLNSDSQRARLRGIARLSLLGTSRAVELLARALDPGGAAHGAEEHLAAVRALAPHAAQPLARDALVRALSSPLVEVDAGSLSEWVQSSAALALAQTQDPAALGALGRALRKPGHAAELTRDALLANPPRDLEMILRVPGAPTKELCEALGALGDLRAEGFLRDIVRRGAPEARAAAALALLQLGSAEVVPLAQHWLHSEHQPILVAAASEILARSGSPDAVGALKELADSDATRPLALGLFLETDGRVTAPARLDPSTAGERAPALLELFARGSAWGMPRIERALTSSESAGLALYALSRAPGATARARLERALTQPGLRALALRCLALRHARLGDDSAALGRAIAASLGAREPSERAAAAFAQGLLEPETLAQSLSSKDPFVVRAVARLATSGSAARAAVLRLQAETDPVTRVALSIGLADAAAAELTPTPLLLEMTHGAGPASLLAAAALAARKDADLLPLLRELLTSGDPWLRAHTLLGLSRTADPDALGLIENAYRFEPDESVRHAAIVALSRRPESVKARTLELAAELDASRSVREAARLALSGQALGDGVVGPETVWLELAKNPGADAAASPAALIRAAGGLALPVVADPDGVVALAYVDSAALDVRLALLAQRVNLGGAVP
ncbi:MAG TPA: HEAT repeat domain-containing protein, partial [Polyangiaceae bacterium]|nr:HEAT repeat domain-containing protein [Polyangiaceae bacterium]